MDNLKPYFKMLNKRNLLLVPIIICVFLGMDGIELFGSIITKSYNIVDGNITFASNEYFALSLLAFILASGFAYKEFNIAISIKGDRKSYLKSSILYMIIMSFIFSIVHEGTQVLIEYILEISSGKNAIVMSNFNIMNITEAIEKTQDQYNLNSGMVAYILGEDEGFIYTIGSILNTWLNITMYSFIGFFISSIFYRLKKSTSILLFAGIPTLSILYILSKVATNDYVFIDKFVNVFLVNLMNILMNYQYMLAIRTSIGILCLIGAILLLRKAPIKEYAHDLI